jgi:hypothetical protein
VLEDLLGKAVTAFAVPGGFYSTRLDSLVAVAGYSQLFTSEPWLHPRARDRLDVHGRFALYAGTSAGEVAELCRRSSSLVLRRRAAWIVRKRARALLGPVYGAARSAALRRKARPRDPG